jgi:hypothetical protein
MMEKKDSYYGVIEEIWELDYGPLKIPLFFCQWVNRVGGGVTTDRYGMTIVEFKKIGYKDEPFVLAKDVTHVFYMKDISSKPKKEMSSKSKNNEPKSLELRIFRTSQKILISLTTFFHSQSMLTPASCYPKRMLLTYAAITTKGPSSNGRNQCSTT